MFRAPHRTSEQLAPAQLWGWVAFAFALAAPRLARAEGPEVAELEYERAQDLEACPDETSFRRAVSERLRRDPFVNGAPKKIRVSLQRNGAALTALVHVEEAGQARGDRRIDTRAGCAELASGAALAVSIAIDPAGALGLGADAEAVPSAAAPPEAPAAAGPTSSKPPPVASAATPSPAEKMAPRANTALPPVSDARWFARVGARAWAGIVPEIGVGPSLGAGYQRAHWSLALDAFSVLPRTESVSNTRRAVSVDLFAARLSPCARLEALRGCALLDAGALIARGEGVDSARTGSSLHAALGLGVGYSLSAGRFSFTPTLEGSARLATSQLSLNDQPVWTTPRWIAALGLELGYDL